MTIWYDVSGLVDWRLPHLGGIERTVTGILDGLHGLGVRVRLLHLPHGGDRFSAVAEGDLPAAVREMCGWLERPAPQAPVAPPPPEPIPEPPPAVTAAAEARARRRRRRRALLYGPGTDGEKCRAAWIAFRVAGRELLRHAGRRLGIGRRIDEEHAGDDPADAVPTVAAPEPPLDVPAAHAPPEVPFMPGDVLMSLGGTFATSGHPAAVDAARDRGAAVVRMVYDLVPVTKPQWLAPRAVEVAWLRHVVQRSDLVLTISDCTRRELLDYCREAGLAPPDVEVVRLGDVIGRGAAVEAPAPLPRFVPQRPFFLCVSSLNVRKNHRCLYDAWTALAADRGDACPDLLCAGATHALTTDLVHEIRHDRLVNRHIHLLDGVRDAELAWYYRRCVATIYPSKHEGWGLPVAESLVHGKLCLASSAASMTEISDLPEFFPAHDTPRLVALVARCLDDPAWLAGREARIAREFRPTAWTDTAAAVLAAARHGGATTVAA
ncbi:MAG: glycosyltransferase [Planctomycetaceae bacterium]